MSEGEAWEFAETVRRNTPGGMQEGTMLTIEMIRGFEKFNTRPYHCYETWCSGWRITDPRLKHGIEREHLQDAVAEWLAALNGERKHNPVVPDDF